MSGPQITATCHCGAVEVRAQLSEPLSNARRCDCSFCARRGAPVVFADQGQLTVIRGADALRIYQFNTMQAEHYFCGTCGIFTHHQHDNPRDGYAINLICIEGVNPQDFDPLPWLDGRGYQPKIHGDT